MKSTIEVWKSEIQLPDKVKESIQNFSPVNLRKSACVDLFSMNGLRFIRTDGICEWHDDSGVDTQYSLLLVVRNDTNSYIESQGILPIKEQPVGTLVLLDIWHEHRLWSTKGNKTDIGVYIVLCADLHVKLLDQKECESWMNEMIQECYFTT